MKKEIETQIKQHQDEIERIKAEASRLKANSKLIKLQNELFRRIIDELDLGNITPQQAFILIKELKPSAGKESDLSARLSIIEGQLEKFKVEAAMIKAQHEAWKFKKDKRHDS
jgi:hypothetical protein